LISLLRAAGKRNTALSREGMALNRAELLVLTGTATPRRRFDFSPPLAFLGAVAVVVSLFLPWLGITLSRCMFTACSSTGTQQFSVLQIAGTSVLLNLLGGPFTSLIPVATSYTTLAVWCLGTLMFGLLFIGWRYRKRDKSSYRRRFPSFFSSIPSFLWSLAQLALVGGTVFQMQQTFAVQNKASISLVHVAQSSSTQGGPLVLLIGLALLSLAAILGMVRPKG
jgi:hypothetical protein